MHIGLGHNVEQSLIGFSILNNRLGFPFDGQDDRSLTLLELFHEIARAATKCRQ